MGVGVKPNMLGAKAVDSPKDPNSKLEKIRMRCPMGYI